MFPLAEIVETFCLLVAVVCLRRSKGSYWLWFIPFLALTILVELSASGITRHGYANHWLYNAFLPVQVAFLGYIYYKIFPPTRHKRIVWMVFALVFVLVFSIESYQNRFLFYNHISDSISGVEFILLTGWYFYLLLQAEESVDLKRFAPFWFVSGVFLFCFGSMATVLFSEAVMKLFIFGRLSVRYLIYMLLNLVLYGFWAYAFACKYRANIS